MPLFCTPPCVPNAAEPIPGAIPPVFNPMANETPTDGDLVIAAGVTSGSIGTWVELMPADADRLGASVQNKAATGSIFILPFATGLPASGTQGGETEIPQAPGYFNFPFVPNQRYVVRGTAASMAYSLNTW